jgi:fucose permease
MQVRKEEKIGLQRGVVAGLYVAALSALTLAPQVTDWTDSAALVAFGTAVGVAFLGPLSYLANAGRRDADAADV